MATKVVEGNSALPRGTKIINAKLVTVIPNSRAEHNIYTYSTKVDTHFDIKSDEFFNPVYTFATVGDIFRIFRWEYDKIVMYYEFLIMNVDKIEKKVQTVLLTEKSFKKTGEK